MDSFFGIGIFELVMIAIVALVVLGPERLPGAMREVAKWIRQLRDISSEFQSQFGEELKMLDEINPRRIINEAIDPKTQPKPTPVQPPAPKPVAPPAKPPVLASSAPVNAAFPAAGAAAASKPANASADAGGENTILPPATGAGKTSSAAETSEPAAPSEAPAASDSEQEAPQ